VADNKSHLREEEEEEEEEAEHSIDRGRAEVPLTRKRASESAKHNIVPRRGIPLCQVLANPQHTPIITSRRERRGKNLDSAP
jgi:hypothetical protein